MTPALRHRVAAWAVLAAVICLVLIPVAVIARAFHERVSINQNAEIRIADLRSRAVDNSELSATQAALQLKIDQSTAWVSVSTQEEAISQLEAKISSLVGPNLSEQNLSRPEVSEVNGLTQMVRVFSFRASAEQAQQIIFSLESSVPTIFLESIAARRNEADPRSIDVTILSRSFARVLPKK